MSAKLGVYLPSQSVISFVPRAAMLPFPQVIVLRDFGQVKEVTPSGFSGGKALVFCLTRSFGMEELG